MGNIYMLQALARSYNDSASLSICVYFFVFCVFRIVNSSLCGPRLPSALRDGVVSTFRQKVSSARLSCA